MAMKKGGLGKGLDLIFAENTIENSSGTMIKINEIEPNRSQPRKDFDAESLAELADSIAMHGVLQPIIARPIFAGGYEIVAGERRWRASRMAGLKEIPVIIKEMDDKEFMQIALIENLQRENLNPIEEARGYEVLLKEHDMNQEEVAKTVGKSRSAVANVLRLMSLPDFVIEMIEKNEISAGHGRTLLGFKDEEDLKKAAELAKQGMSVRALEALQKKCNQEHKPKKQTTRNNYFVEAELALNEFLGRKIKVDGTSKKGVIQIEFYGEDDLKEIMKNFKG
ncbi:MAG: ParB/RepB/Spo0J family partition protein [Clostridia bacterium]